MIFDTVDLAGDRAVGDAEHGREGSNHSVSLRDASLGDVLANLEPHRGLRMVFSYAGHDTSPGYHITEIKSARFSAIDCGANPEAWDETYVQLWDIPEEAGYQPITVGKALGILGVVEKRVGLARAGRVTFEVSDGVAPMALYRAETLRILSDRLVIDLRPQASSCKPRDRWLANAGGEPMQACAPSVQPPSAESGATRCCG